MPASSTVYCLFSLTFHMPFVTFFNIKKMDSVGLAMPDATEDAEYRVVELLADNPDLTQREMAQRLGL